MEYALEVLAGHGVLVVAVWVFAVHVGVPIPTAAFLLGVGALAGFGKLSLGWALLAAVGGSLVADLLWYTVGRRFGSRGLEIVCRISLGLESRVRRARKLFLAHRLVALVAGKFLLEVNAAMTALAGSSGIRLGEFLVFDVASALLWAGTWMGVGYAVWGSAGQVAVALGWSGASVVLLAAALGGYLAFKYVRRQQCLGGPRAARIGPS